MDAKPKKPSKQLTKIANDLLKATKKAEKDKK